MLLRRSLQFILPLLVAGPLTAQEKVYVSTGFGYVLHGDGTYCAYDTLRPMSDTVFVDLAQTPDGRLFGISSDPWGTYLTLYEIDTLTGEAQIICPDTVPAVSLVAVDFNTLLYVNLEDSVLTKFDLPSCSSQPLVNGYVGVEVAGDLAIIGHHIYTIERFGDLLRLDADAQFDTLLSVTDLGPTSLADGCYGLTNLWDGTVPDPDTLLVYRGPSVHRLSVGSMATSVVCDPLLGDPNWLGGYYGATALFRLDDSPKGVDDDHMIAGRITVTYAPSYAEIHMSTTMEQLLVLDGLGRVVMSVRDPLQVITIQVDAYPAGAYLLWGLAHDRSPAVARLVLP